MESGIQPSESGIHDVESGIRYSLGFLYMGRTVDATARHVLKKAKGRKTGIQICQPTFEVPIKMPAKNRFNA